jgi:anion-transporting  ArsA/GET3 family ATPase
MSAQHSMGRGVADANTLDLRALVDGRRIVVCCGSGGVGKTTTAAALGYLAASRGRKALVMTIDPAKRLAQALGLDALGDEPQRIATPSVSGELSAMMLDTKRTFDALIERYAPTGAARETIFANSYYQHLSNSLAGSREFMAMEKVYEMLQTARYDVLIVDTPPAQHALDFLEAPARLFDLFEGTFVNLLLQPYRVAGRFGFDLFRRSSDRLLKVFEKLTGYDVLADLSDFFLAFAGMSAGFKERSQRVLATLRRPETSFLLICAPEPASLQQVDRFFARLKSESMPIGGVIVNRVHAAEAIFDGSSYALTDDDMARVAPSIDTRVDGVDLANRLMAAYRDQLTLAALDLAALDATDWLRTGVPIHRVPHFDRDLHSLPDVAAFAAALQGGGQSSTATAAT